eukprot:scaffold67766_cov52-Cyclotella_meneghiniana.AAC.2
MRYWDTPAAMVWMLRSTQFHRLTLVELEPQSDFSPLLELNIQPAETLAGKAFQSKMHIIIRYIHNEILGHSSSNGLDVAVHTVSLTYPC